MYLPRKDPTISYTPTFLIGGNMYDEDHDVDKVALIEERLAAILGESTTSQKTSVEDKNQGPGRIADVLTDTGSTLGLAAPTDKTQQYTIKRNRLYAMGIHFNAAKKKLVLPVLSEVSEHIRKAHSRSDQADAASGAIKKEIDKCDESENFLLQSVDMPTFTNAILAIMAQCRINLSLLWTIKESSTVGITPNVYTPENASASEAKLKTTNYQSLEKHMGEHVETQTKMNTSLSIEPRLLWIGDSLSYLENFDCAFLRVIYDVQEEQEHRPYLYDVVQRIAKAITTKAFRVWSK